jgi:hypothetical protein
MADEKAKDYVTAAARLLMPTYVSEQFVDIGKELDLCVDDVQGVIRKLSSLWGWHIEGRKHVGGYRVVGWQEPQRIPRARRRQPVLFGPGKETG